MKLQLAADQPPPQHPSLVLQSFESCAVGGDDQGVNSKFLNEQDVELITGRSGSGTSGVRDQCRTHPNSLSTTASTDLADATRAAAASPLHLSIAAGSNHIVSKGSSGEAGRSSAAAAAAAVHQVHCYGEEEPHTNMEDQREVLGVESCSRHTKESSEPHIMREQEAVDLSGGDIQSRHVRDVTVQANDFQTWRYQRDQQLRTAGAAAAAALAGRRDKLDSEPTAAQCVSLEGGGAAPRGVMYRECQKNLAADRGVCAIDGCGEFMPSGLLSTALDNLCANLLE
jgi:ZF-HD homeobox protein with Cys/His-rich dimerization domain